MRFGGLQIMDKNEGRKPKVVKTDQEVGILEQPPPQPPYYELINSWPPRRQRDNTLSKVAIIISIVALMIGFSSLLLLYGSEVIPGFTEKTITTTAISTVTTTRITTVIRTSNLLNWSAVLYVCWQEQIPYDGEITLHDIDMNRRSTITVSHGVAIYSNITKDQKRIKVNVEGEEREIDLMYGRNWIYTITLQTHKKAKVKIMAYDNNTNQMLDKFTLKVNGTEFGTETKEFPNWSSENELNLTIPGDYTIDISKEGYYRVRIDLKDLKADITLRVPLIRKEKG